MRVPLWVKRGGIRFPEGRACIMVGPGTGIAPFRSAAHERSGNSANGDFILQFNFNHFTVFCFINLRKN